MQELKFRTLNLDSGEFIYFDLNDPDEQLFGRHGVLENTVIGEWQQSSTVIDRENKTIYDGDLLEVTGGELPQGVYKVYQVNGCFYLESKEGKWSEFGRLNAIAQPFLKIVGNVSQNVYKNINTLEKVL